MFSDHEAPDAPDAYVPLSREELGALCERKINWLAQKEQQVHEENIRKGMKGKPLRHFWSGKIKGYAPGLTYEQSCWNYHKVPADSFDRYLDTRLTLIRNYEARRQRCVDLQNAIRTTPEGRMIWVSSDTLGWLGQTPDLQPVATQQEDQE